MPRSATGGPCVTAMDSMLTTSNTTLLIVGHSHTVAHYGNQLLIGNGGAPIRTGAPYGFATVRQNGSSFTITIYDYNTAMPVSTFTMP